MSDDKRKAILIETLLVKLTKSHLVCLRKREVEAYRRIDEQMGDAYQAERFQLEDLITLISQFRDEEE